MISQKELDFSRIKMAIEFVQSNFKRQPSLNQIADHVGVSPFHFQKLFTNWAGVSPKKFLQYISLNHAKRLLNNDQPTLFNTAIDTGLSSTSRLHDLFVNFESMTPGEYKNGGQRLKIEYSFSNSLFGAIIIGSTEKGLCHVAFIDNEKAGLADLKNKFPKATFISKSNQYHDDVIAFLNIKTVDPQKIKLHVKGSDFQIKVWEALLQIPPGKLITYGSLAKKINKPKASRAVGTAIGSNPIAFLIPCHRVIQSSGKLGGYRWGESTKAAIIGWESSQSKSIVS